PSRLYLEPRPRPAGVLLFPQDHFRDCATTDEGLLCSSLSRPTTPAPRTSHRNGDPIDLLATQELHPPLQAHLRACLEARPAGLREARSTREAPARRAPADPVRQGRSAAPPPAAIDPAAAQGGVPGGRGT